MDSPFTLLLRVRYAECDAQQVVFNARYADYLDIAATEFVRAVVGGYQNLIEAGMDTQVVNLNINWQAPAKFDDVIAIQLSTARIGNTSYTLSAEMFDHASNTKLVDAQITYVMVDTQHYQKMPVPEHYRLALENAARGTVINQAG